MQLKNEIGALEPELLRIQSSSDLEVLPETISGSPQSGILASGSSARTAPSHGKSRNGRKGFEPLPAGTSPVTVAGPLRIRTAFLESLERF
jgi:hypothetical protein